MTQNELGLLREQTHQALSKGPNYTSRSEQYDSFVMKVIEQKCAGVAL